MTTTNPNYTVPANPAQAWVDLTILRGVVEAYDRYRGGLSMREPAITTADAMRDVEGVMRGACPAVADLPRTRRATMVKSAIRRLVRVGALVQSIGCGESGREARMLDPGTGTTAGAILVTLTAAVAAGLAAERAVELARELASDRCYDAGRTAGRYVDYVDAVDEQGRPSAVAVKETMFTVEGITRHLEAAGFGQVEGVDVTARKDLTRLGLGVTVECEVTWVDHPA